MPKNLLKLSASSFSAVIKSLASITSKKLPIIYENVSTPPNSMIALKNLSKFEYGLRSPNPTVVSVVNAK